MKKVKNKKYIKNIICVLLCFLFLISAFGCADKEKDKGDKSQAELGEINPEDYISSLVYKGLVIVAEEEKTKEERLWNSILENAEFSSYPEDRLAYYTEQEKAYYMYLADGDEAEYRRILEMHGITEESIAGTALTYVKKDIAFLYVVKKENISVTEEEKARLFDKYVEKYVEDYGYNTEYVKENMADVIYESMLYDKTLEYLISVNTFE